MSFFDGIKGVLARWLGIVPAQQPLQIIVRENTTKEANTLKNQLWYRGDPAELEQFFKKMAELSVDGYTQTHRTRFWAAVPSNDLIRKFHSGLPRMIVDKLAAIVVNDMNEPEMDQAMKSRWDDIAKVINFGELLKDAVTRALSEGDGAFKICIDPDLSPLPLLEFYSGNNVEFKYKRGQLIEIIFYTDYWKDTQHYRLKEIYGKGFVNYVLLNDLNQEMDMTALDETAQLQNATFAGNFIMGVPLKFYKSAKWSDRGDSIFEGKSDLFDAMDEILSTWMDTLRATRPKQYIPDTMIPRDENDGTLMKPDVFNPYFVTSGTLAEDGQDKVEVVQPKLEPTGLFQSYTTILDSILQGLISPSTLGIDVKKMDNAESQREKEKTTMYTRDGLIKVLAEVLPQLVCCMLMTQDNMAGSAPQEDYEATFEWGQYANPSFEAMVETIGKAKTQGIMSVEQCVEELYGDTMEDEDKAEEVARIKAEANPPLSVDEPAVNDDLKSGMMGGEGNGGL